MREILLRRRKKIIVPTFEQEHHNECYVASINKNIEDLGFCFSKDLFNALSQCDIDYLKDIYEEICSLIAEMVGADLDYRPMYPNFPKSVMQRNEYELYFNALIHYWTGGQLIPYEQVEARELRIQRADLNNIF